MAARGPAGISTAGKAPRPKGRKAAGKNVDAFLAREAEIHRAVEYTRQNELQAYKATWEENQVKKQSRNGKSQKEKEYVGCEPQCNQGLMWLL